LARVDMRELCRPHLKALTAATGETSTLSVPYREGTITVDFVQSPSSVRSVAELGRPGIPHATATGKVFLAFSDAGAPSALTPYTSKTITDPSVLEEQIAGIRRRGWGQAIGERETGLNAIACPVLSAGRLIAILGVQGPGQRFGPKAMRRAAVELRDHCVELSTQSSSRTSSAASRTSLSAHRRV
jgi:DNA-binding IclR family transcriptional regulator